MATHYFGGKIVSILSLEILFCKWQTKKLFNLKIKYIRF